MIRIEPRAYNHLMPNCKALRRAVEQQQPPALREALAEAQSIGEISLAFRHGSHRFATDVARGCLWHLVALAAMRMHIGKAVGKHSWD